MAVDKKMTLKEVYVYIRDKYGDLVSYKTTWYWLRKKLKLRYSKPYVRDERRPENAEEIFKKLSEALSDLNDPIIGFCDETSFMSSPNKLRVFGGGVVKHRLPSRRERFYALGCMLLNGNDVVLISDSARTGDFITLLYLVRRHNPERPIVLVVDNAKIHSAERTIRTAISLGIRFVFLPPYSPDLNPIEFSWRDCKRDLWLLSMNEARVSFKKTFMKYVEERKMSYSRRWLERYGDILTYKGVLLKTGKMN